MVPAAGEAEGDDGGGAAQAGLALDAKKQMTPEDESLAQVARKLCLKRDGIRDRVGLNPENAATE